MWQKILAKPHYKGVCALCHIENSLGIMWQNVAGSGTNPRKAPVAGRFLLAGYVAGCGKTIKNH